MLNAKLPVSKRREYQRVCEVSGKYRQKSYATESTAHTFDPVFNRKLLAKENCPEYGSAELVGRSLRLLNNTDQEDEQVGIVDEEVLHTMNAEIGNLKKSLHEMLRQMGQFEQSLAWALHKINHMMKYNLNPLKDDENVDELNEEDNKSDESTIQETVDAIVTICKANNINDHVDILRIFQDKTVLGRKLDIVDD
ncbi:unnamed protein product [Mytilus coruscus]|uniref:Uncharacterized protein n=1 Tax=Mytilus coruscus TaxID=42192 RepID=A0A6J8DK30_MYTCO|nr:unnamed protein product [Mytilus coruscus]